MIDTKEQLLKYLSENKAVVIYGTGEVAGVLASWIDKIGACDRIKCFCVSSKATGTQEKFWGKSVIELSQLSHIDKGSILVATMQDKHLEISNTILINKEIDIEKVEFLLDSLIYQLRFEMKQYKLLEENNNLLKSISRENEKKMPNTQLGFSVHLCEHCNLNCAGCNNFSPLAKETFTDIKIYERDMKRLAELSGGDAYRIQLTGGEPFLNKRAIEYAIIARKNFPSSRIGFLTNGILLKQQSKEFFEKCREYSIAIDFSPYPLDLDYESMRDELISSGIDSRFNSGNEIIVDGTWRKETMTLKSDNTNSPAKHNWSNCYMANLCIQLSDGKLSCTKISCVHHFLDAFPDKCKDMKLSPRDFIDIYKVDDVQQIFDFFAKPLPFCRFCDVDNYTYDGKWAQSKRDICEWI